MGLIMPDIKKPRVGPDGKPIIDAASSTPPVSPALGGFAVAPAMTGTNAPRSVSAPDSVPTMAESFTNANASRPEIAPTQPASPKVLGQAAANIKPAATPAIIPQAPVSTAPATPQPPALGPAPVVTPGTGYVQAGNSRTVITPEGLKDEGMPRTAPMPVDPSKPIKTLALGGDFTPEDERPGRLVNRGAGYTALPASMSPFDVLLYDQAEGAMNHGTPEEKKQAFMVMNELAQRHQGLSLEQIKAKNTATLKSGEWAHDLEVKKQEGRDKFLANRELGGQPIYDDAGNIVAMSGRGSVVKQPNANKYNAVSPETRADAISEYVRLKKNPNTKLFGRGQAEYDSQLSAAEAKLVALGIDPATMKPIDDAQGQQAGQPASTQPVKVSSEAEFQKLPSGTMFIDTKGVTRRKP